MKTHRRMASAIRLHACNLLGSIKVPMGTIPRDGLFHERPLAAEVLRSAERVLVCFWLKPGMGSGFQKGDFGLCGVRLRALP